MRLPFLALVTLVAASCRPPVRYSPADLPAGHLVFQPHFMWRGGEETRQGTGFFVRTGSGESLGVTSAHFVDFDGPALNRADWELVTTGEAVARFDRHLGKPGDGGRPDDLRTDYLILVPNDGIDTTMALELDPRRRPGWRERVWLPNKDETAPRGYSLIAGTVVYASVELSEVQLDQKIHLQSQSGSPVISQMTGKVIGTLARGGEYDRKVHLLLTPSAAIVAAIASADQTHELSAVVGR